MTTLLEVQNLVKQFPIVGSRKVVQAVKMRIENTVGRSYLSRLRSRIETH